IAGPCGCFPPTILLLGRDALSPLWQHGETAHNKIRVVGSVRPSGSAPYHRVPLRPETPIRQAISTQVTTTNRYTPQDTTTTDTSNRPFTMSINHASMTNCSNTITT